MDFHRLVERGRAIVDAWSRDQELLATLRHLLEHRYEPVLQALLALTLVCLAVTLPTWLRTLRRLPLTTCIGLLAVLNLALLLRLNWAPHMPQVYFDEILFLDTADNLAHHGLNALTMFEGRHSGPEFHPCPQGWQFLISRVYWLAGSEPAHAFRLAAWLSSLTVVAAFVATWLLTASERTGLLAALFLAVLPVHVRLAGSAALETASGFFLVTLVAVAVLALQERKVALVLLASCLLAWFVNIRMENSFALLPLLLLAFVVGCPSAALAAWRMRLATAAAMLLALLFATPALLADYYGLATHFYYFYVPPAVIEAQVNANLLGNARFWLDNAIHPGFLSALAVVGFVTAPRRRLAWVGALWWLLLVLFYSHNPSCDFSLSHTLDSWRTALHPTLGLLLLAALGAEALLGWLQPHRRAVLLLLVVWSLTVPSTFRGFVQKRTPWMLAWELQARFREVLPPDAYLLVHDNLPQLGAQSTSLARELIWTTGCMPHYFAIPEAYEGRDGEPLPHMAQVIGQWVEVENRPVFIYHLSTGTSQEVQGLAKLQRAILLEVVLQATDVATGSSFALYRARGARKAQPLAPSRPSR